MANNQYVNKVVFGDLTLIDLSGDTIYSSALLTGITAHRGNGQPITGTMQHGAPALGFNNGRLEISFPYGCYSGLMHLESIRVPIPSSGTNNITIKVPNGTITSDSSNEEDWIPITFTVDTEGNSEITDGTQGPAEVVYF